jgi:hypothetical protein
MRKLAMIFSISSAALIAFTSAKAESIPLMIGAIAFGLAWIIVVSMDASPVNISMLLAAETAIACLNILYGASFYLTGLAIGLFIISWDLALTARTIAGLSSTNRRRFCIHHFIQIATISALGFGFLIIPNQIEMTIGFRTALGLSMAALMLACLLLKLITNRTS